jgi:uncharacterized protein YjbI with pentapeptide repeats
MKDERPRIGVNEMHRLLREGRISDFNARRLKGETPDFRGVDLRGCDLRGANLDGLDLSNSYFRQADLRGLNLTTCKIEGASMIDANVSGAYFPKELSAEEIRLSLEHGTRMRYRT